MSRKRCKSLFLQIFQAMIDGIWRPILDFTDRTSWVQGVQAKLGIFLSMYSMNGHPVGLSLPEADALLLFFVRRWSNCIALCQICACLLCCYCKIAKKSLLYYHHQRHHGRSIAALPCPGHGVCLSCSKTIFPPTALQKILYLSVMISAFPDQKSKNNQNQLFDCLKDFLRIIKVREVLAPSKMVS